MEQRGCDVARDGARAAGQRSQGGSGELPAGAECTTAPTTSAHFSLPPSPEKTGKWTLSTPATPRLPSLPSLIVKPTLLYRSGSSHPELR